MKGKRVDRKDERVMEACHEWRGTGRVKEGRGMERARERGLLGSNIREFSIS